MDRKQIITDLEHELNFRKRGHDQRIERLMLAGIPTDFSGMSQKLKDLRIEQHTEERGVFYPCVVRITSGVDDSLPKLGHYGCRIQMVPVTARLCKAGEICSSETEDQEAEYWESDTWVVQYGSVGPGYMAPVFIEDDGFSKEEIESRVRKSLIEAGCFATYSEAMSVLGDMLKKRSGIED